MTLPSEDQQQPYVGPIRETSTEHSWQSPWDPDDDRPLVVASFSTTGLWDRRGRIARTVAAVAYPERPALSTSTTAGGGRTSTGRLLRRLLPPLVHV